MASSIQLVFSDTFWIKVAYAFRKYLTGDEIHLLFYLANWSITRGKGEKEAFFCHMQQIMDELYMSKNVQTRVISSLVDKGFLEVDYVGFPPRRWIKIDWKKLESTAIQLYKELKERRETRKLKRRKKSMEKTWQFDNDPD